jgi:hypothetical protein
VSEGGSRCVDLCISRHGLWGVKYNPCKSVPMYRNKPGVGGEDPGARLWRGSTSLGLEPLAFLHFSISRGWNDPQRRSGGMKMPPEMAQFHIVFSTSQIRSFETLGVECNTLRHCYNIFLAGSLAAGVPRWIARITPPRIMVLHQLKLS